MANRYWVGGTANWDGTAGTKWALTSGGVGGQAVPTSADDVFFDASSGAVTVTVSATANCRSLTCTGFTGTLTNNSGINCYGSLILTSTATFSGISSLIMAATSTGWTITSGGANLPWSVTFNGVGGGWTLSDTVNWSTSLWTVTNGALSIANRTVTLLRFTMSGGSADCTNATMTFNQGWQCSSSSTQTTTGSSLTVSTIVTMECTSALNNWTVPAGATLTLNSDVTCNGTFTIGSGASVTVPAVVATNIGGTTRTLTAAAKGAAPTDVHFKDIAFAGAAAPFTGTRIGNRQGNSGITFTTGVNKYWVGNTASWTAANVWATTSGGAGATNNFPLPQDTCIFDSNSFSADGQTTTATTQHVGGLDFSGITRNNITLAYGTTTNFIHGDFILKSGMLFSGTTGTINLVKRGSVTLNTAGITLTNNLATAQDVDSGSSVTLSTHLNLTGAAQRTLTLGPGTFNANNFNVTAGVVNANTTQVRTINMGSGTWTVTGTGTVWSMPGSSNTTLNASTSTIVVNNATSTAKTIATGGKTHNNIQLTGSGTGTFDFTGSGTFNTFTCDTPPHSIRFTAGTTTTVSTWNVNGTAGNLMTIGSITAANHNLVKAGGGYVSCNYMSISRSQATPSTATWWAGNNSTDGGNNSGWTFTAPAWSVIAAVGNFTLTGQVANLLATRKVIANVGAFTLTGYPVNFIKGFRVVAGAGNFVLSGQDAGLLKDSRLVGDAGAFTYTGQDAALYRILRIIAEMGTFSAGFQDVRLWHQGYQTAPPKTSNWAGESGESSTWNPESEESTDWSGASGKATTWNEQSEVPGDWS